MNFQCKPLKEPLKVLFANPLSPSSKLIIVKIMSGFIFGHDQAIDLTLLVYSNEEEDANDFKIELQSCAFSCNSSISVTSDLPSITDYDVFCFSTNFSNPNYLDLGRPESDKQFDTLYLITKIAHNFAYNIDKMEEEKKKSKDKKTKPIKSVIRKPIIMADGLVAIDILNSLSKNLPYDIFFCPSPIPALATAIIADCLKVQCNSINNVFVWAANDDVFHVDFEKPLLVNEKLKIKSPCDLDLIGKDTAKRLHYDTNKFSSSWMKKEFIKKVASSTMHNPYGCIYRAAVFAQTLRDIWLMRLQRDEVKINSNIGVISDGSLGTLKGYPYTLPIIFNGDTWAVNKIYEEDVHLKQEIKRINKAVKLHHDKLITYCKKFLEDNVINKEFVPTEDESEYAYY